MSGMTMARRFGKKLHSKPCLAVKKYLILGILTRTPKSGGLTHRRRLQRAPRAEAARSAVAAVLNACAASRTAGSALSAASRAARVASRSSTGRDTRAPTRSVTPTPLAMRGSMMGSGMRLDGRSVSLRR